MSDMCLQLHDFFQKFKRFEFPYSETQIPMNGIYILFEKDEKGHNADRIVRIGTHTGENRLRSRLKQHFINENKNRSIFRKNIGRCLLNENNDSYINIWELDNTSREDKLKNKNLINNEYEKKIEKEITKYIQNKFSFCVIEVDNTVDRLILESKLISTVSLCKECKPSESWLGLYSPKEKIRESGLWLVNELYKEPLKIQELDTLKMNHKD